VPQKSSDCIHLFDATSNGIGTDASKQMWHCGVATEKLQCGEASSQMPPCCIWKMLGAELQWQCHCTLRAQPKKSNCTVDMRVFYFSKIKLRQDVDVAMMQKSSERLHGVVCCVALTMALLSSAMISTFLTRFRKARKTLNRTINLFLFFNQVISEPLWPCVWRCYCLQHAARAHCALQGVALAASPPDAVLGHY